MDRLSLLFESMTVVALSITLLTWLGVTPAALAPYSRIIIIVFFSLAVIFFVTLRHIQSQVKLFGNPASVDKEKIRFYVSRETLPRFQDVFHNVEEVFILGVSNYELTHNPYAMTSLLEEIQRGATATFLILNPDSKRVPMLQSALGTKNTKKDIEAALTKLRDDKSLLGAEANQRLRIRKYDRDIGHSLIVVYQRSGWRPSLALFIDYLKRSLLKRENGSGLETAKAKSSRHYRGWIQVENYVLAPEGDYPVELRPNRICTQKDNKLFFERHINELTKFENDSQPA